MSPQKNFLRQITSTKRDPNQSPLLTPANNKKNTLNTDRKSERMLKVYTYTLFINPNKSNTPESYKNEDTEQENKHVQHNKVTPQRFTTPENINTPRHYVMSRKNHELD